MNPAEIIEAARMAIDVALMLVPHEELKVLLDEQAVKRANATADAAEAAKFSP